MMTKQNINSQKTSPLIKIIMGVVVSSSLLLPSLAKSDEVAMALLNKMNQALHQLSYKGTLAYLRGDELSTLHINHTVVGGVETERVVSLNDSAGEVSREVKGFSLASIPKIRPEMEKVYSFDIGRVNRIANIPCVIVTARPKDRERYLQKYCIDTVTGMLLDYMLVGKSHKPVEQFMFTSLEVIVPESVSSNSAQACGVQNCSNTLKNEGSLENTTAIVDQSINSKSKEKATVVVPQVSKPMFHQVSNMSLDDGWVMEALPAGYEIRQAPNMKDDADKLTKHYIVSDGLSSLSVFVSPLTDDTPIERIQINSGALNVVSQRKAGHVVTVVGEVPEITLKNIVKNLRKK